MLHDIGQESTIPDIVAVGNLASQIHVPVTELVRVAGELAIEPAARINGIPHYAATAAERIAARVRQMDQYRTY